MRVFLRAATVLSFLFAVQALADSPPQVEVAPVLGGQFFRGFGESGPGNDQALQNNVVIGARGGAVFSNRVRLELGLDFTPTVVVGADKLTYVLQPHLDGSIDLTGGWIRPYVGLGVGLIGFVENDWVGATFASIGGEENAEANPDVEFSAAALAGVRLHMGEVIDFLDGAAIRLDVRDIFYAPRNNAVNYMNAVPGSLVTFHNLQFSLSFAWIFDAFGDTMAEDDYESDLPYTYQ